MVFDYGFSDKLKIKTKSLLKSDKALADQLYKKIKEIASRDSESIDFYKNLRAPLNDYKRVHVGNFVLLFKVEKEKNYVLFADFGHHDDIYEV